MKNIPKDILTSDAITSYFLKEFGHDLKTHFPFSNSQTLPNEQSNSDCIDLSLIKKNAIACERNGSYFESCILYYQLSFCDDPSLAIDASLGIAKCLAHLGYLARATCWASLGMAIARHNELSFKMAQASWVRGNALVRGGKFQLAYDSFALDFALLPPGHPQRTGALSMQAYALGQMGAETSLAAESMYRIAAHMFSKEDPSNFAYSGLALLGALHQKKQLFNEAFENVINCTTPYILFRMEVASFLNNPYTPQSFHKLMLYSQKLNSKKYRWELAWIKRCSQFMNVDFKLQLSEQGEFPLPPFPTEHPAWSLVSKLEFDGIEMNLPDCGLNQWNWANTLEELIQQRICICL